MASRHYYLHAKVSVLVWGALGMRPNARRQGMKAARLADDGVVFFVTERLVDAEDQSSSEAPPAGFTDALESRGFRLVETRSFPGLPPHTLGVFVFRRAA